MTDFGRDVSCLDSLRLGQYVSGVRLVAEAAYRRLITPRGTLRGGAGEAEYGLDLTDMIGSVRTKSDAKALAGMIRNELLKDERIATVDASVTPIADGITTTFSVVVLATTKEGPFSLNLAVSAVTVDILGIST